MWVVAANSPESILPISNVVAVILIALPELSLNLYVPWKRSAISKGALPSVPGPGDGVSPEQDANEKRVNAQRSAMMILFMGLFLL